MFEETRKLMSNMLKVKHYLLVIFSLTAFISSSLIYYSVAKAAPCPTSDGGYGSVSGNVNISSPGSYRVWSRIKANTTAGVNNNSYWLIVDGTNCFVVGDSQAAIADGQWVWVDYQDASSTSKINVNFTSTGNHTVKMLGREANVQLDRVIFTTDTTSGACNPPVDTGDACAVNSPTVTPATLPPASASNLTASAASASQINLSWTASSTPNVIYDIYHALSGSAPIKIASVTSLSFGDVGLSPSTSYSYYVITRDNLGNVSVPTPTVSVTTLSLPPPATTTGSITGTIKDASGAVPRRSHVSLLVNGSTKTYSPTSTGSYAISNLPPAAYTVTYSASKYVTQSYVLTVPSGGTVTKNVILLKR